MSDGGREPDADRLRERDDEGPATAPGGRDRSRQTANLGLALDLGMRLGISVILGLAAGLALDGWLGTSPLFTLLGIVLGIAAAMYTIWDVARDSMRR